MKAVPEAMKGVKVETKAVRMRGLPLLMLPRLSMPKTLPMLGPSRSQRPWRMPLRMRSKPKMHSMTPKMHSMMPKLHSMKLRVKKPLPRPKQLSMTPKMHSMTPKMHSMKPIRRLRNWHPLRRVFLSTLSQPCAERAKAGGKSATSWDYMLRFWDWHSATTREKHKDWHSAITRGWMAKGKWQKPLPVTGKA